MRMRLTDFGSEPLSANLETASQASWSPNGRSLLAVQLIEAASPNIDQMQNLTHHPSLGREPAWSPMIDLPWKTGWRPSFC